MTFDVAATAYDRFMGRYSTKLAVGFVDFMDVRPGQKALDVGCGPGAATAELVRRLGPETVTAVDPSEQFVEAARSRYPGVDVRQCAAEDLPFADATFDASGAQLVVHFMSDPVRGLAEMSRVTRSEGIVAACVWDLAGGRAPMSPFWQAVREIDSAPEDEASWAGTNEGDLRRLLQEAGLRDVEETALAVEVEHATFEEWWDPFTLGVGPAGAYLQRLDEAAVSRIRDRCKELLPEPPFTLRVVAWAARGRV